MGFNPGNRTWTSCETGFLKDFAKEKESTNLYQDAIRYYWGCGGQGVHMRTSTPLSAIALVVG